MIVLTLKQRKARNGYLYILPWVIGMICLFIPAVIRTFVYSFSKVDAETFETTFVALNQYVHARWGDDMFLRLLADILLNNLRTIPLILIFSYFVALLLKKEFRGIQIVKAIFFLTVILSSDMFIALQLEIGNITAAQNNGVMESASVFFDSISGRSFYQLLYSFGISQDTVILMDGILENITDTFIKSGVQIFIFLAGLSSIPESMYEAASMEGATAWESFWKITFPLTTPIIMVGFVYTVVDSFNSMLSPTMQYIYDMAFGSSRNFGYSSAMTVIYFLVISITLAIVFALTRKKVFYYV